MNIPEMKHIPSNDSLKGQFMLVEDIEYRRTETDSLKLSVIAPWAAVFGMPCEKLPLVVFIQGSGWTVPNLGFEIPQLSELAKKGFVVATVSHRDSRVGNPFPAYLQDVKCAIRFLRANAARFGIDPDHVAAFGTSSGGNTALLVGLTPGKEEFETPEYAGVSDAVNCVVDCFGPSDLTTLGPLMRQAPTYAHVFYALFGPDESTWEEKEKAMSPISYVGDPTGAPAFLVLSGNADEQVPFESTRAFYEALYEHGYTVDGYQVDGALHEMNFWSAEINNIIADFIAKHI